MTTLAQMEQELAWLAKRVNTNKDLIARAEEFFKANQHRWSRGVMEYFFKMIEGMKDQQFFEESRLENLAWKIIMERDGRD